MNTISRDTITHCGGWQYTGVKLATWKWQYHQVCEERYTQENQAKNMVPDSYRFTLYRTSINFILSKDFPFLWAISGVLFIVLAFWKLRPMKTRPKYGAILLPFYSVWDQQQNSVVSKDFIFLWAISEGSITPRFQSWQPLGNISSSIHR